jgi:hypothetical protein
LPVRRLCRLIGERRRRVEIRPGIDADAEPVDQLAAEPASPCG